MARARAARSAEESCPSAVRPAKDAKSGMDSQIPKARYRYRRSNSPSPSERQLSAGTLRLILSHPPAQDRLPNRLPIHFGDVFGERDLLRANLPTVLRVRQIGHDPYDVQGSVEAVAHVRAHRAEARPACNGRAHRPKSANR